MITMNNKQGLLFVAEGIDGCGKTTFLKELEKELLLLGQNVLLTKEPGATKLGKDLREMLMSKTYDLTPLSEYLLFAADRAEHFFHSVIPHLQQGGIVLSDRMGDSSLVYQGIVKKVPINFMKKVNAVCMQQQQPTRVFYLKIDSKIAEKRLKERGKILPFEKTVLEQQSIITAGFDKIFLKRADVSILNAQESVSSLTKQALQVIKKFIK